MGEVIRVWGVDVAVCVCGALEGCGGCRGEACDWEGGRRYHVVVLGFLTGMLTNGASRDQNRFFKRRERCLNFLLTKIQQTIYKTIPAQPFRETT